MFHDVEYITRTCNVHKCQSQDLNGGQDLNGEEANVINDTHMCICTCLLLMSVITLTLRRNLLDLTILRSNKNI